MATVSTANARYLADVDPPLCALEVKDAFNGLTDIEKLYAHHMSVASWAGARIIMRQWTAHAETIFDLIISIFTSSKDKNQITDLNSLKERSGISDEDWTNLLSYAAQVLSNLANYKSFGDTKFVPRAPQDSFAKLVEASESKAAALPLWEKVQTEIYALEPEGILHIGKPEGGHVSNYYPDSPDITEAEIQAVQEVLDKANISALNTRLAKKSPKEYVLLIASVTESPHPLKSLSASDNSFTVELRRGDYSAELSKVNAALAEASKYAEKDNRKGMIADYIKSFDGGDVEDHKDASRKWVDDVGPVVETYIGFIENYVDPFARSAEWEGFAAIGNKEQSAKYTTLVDRAPELCALLPWGKNFEVDTFRRPDFTALEVLNFATGGIPAGINIPNYFEIREQQGFKNVSLSNILSASAPNEKLPFLTPEDEKLYKEWDRPAFEVQVALHELLGHGSGKELKELKDGSFNFDKEKTVNPFTGKPVTSWYKPGENYGSKIGAVGPSMEECRAEAVALYLCSIPEILKVFDITSKEDIETVQYAIFLLMVRAGLRGLEFFDPATGKHGQAHMQARLAITNWLIDAKIADVEQVRDDKGALVDAIVRLDRKAVLEQGQEAIGKLLVHLQVLKSTADAKGATEFYTKISKPRDNWAGELRDFVLAQKQPRKIFVQGNTHIVDGKVELKEYPLTSEGMIQSFVERGL